MAAKKTGGFIIGGLAIGAIAAVTAVATAHDMKQEKRAKREMHKHKDLVEQKKQYTQHGNIQNYNPLSETKVALLGFHNKFLSAYKNGTIELKKRDIGSNEIFTTIPITKGVESQQDYRMKVCFKLNGTDLYLCCEKNGKLTVKQWCRRYEKWVVEKEEKSGMFSFKSFHNTYLCAQKGKAIANRKRKRDWEKWRVIVVQDAKPKQQQTIKQNTTQDSSTKPPEPMVENDGSYY